MSHHRRRSFCESILRLELRLTLFSCHWERLTLSGLTALFPASPIDWSALSSGCSDELLATLNRMAVGGMARSERVCPNFKLRSTLLQPAHAVRVEHVGHSPPLLRSGLCSNNAALAQRTPLCEEVYSKTYVKREHGTRFLPESKSVAKQFNMFGILSQARSKPTSHWDLTESTERV